MRDPNQEHVIAVVFFTPGDWKSNETTQSMMIQAGPMGPRGEFEDGIVYKICLIYIQSFEKFKAPLFDKTHYLNFIF